MKTVYYLAVDIGASSGRHVLAWVKDGRLCTEEVYRFPNGLVDRDGTLCWDHEALASHVIEGMKQCATKGMIPSYMGIDTWGVDFVLLDGDDRLLGNAVGYRDSRTEGMDSVLCQTLTEEELYARTGIQKQPYNTVYQLLALQRQHPEQLRKARALLMMPDYLNFVLTGVKHQEYTNATTAQLVNLATEDWDRELIRRLGLPEELFGTLSLPGQSVGTLRPEIRERIGYDLQVLHPASHDTGSAVLAVPTNSDNIAYISSGTWSLMGVESSAPIATPEARACNFTNEGGYGKRYRFLKNIMGLWLIQSVRRELGPSYSFDDLCRMAKEHENTAHRLNVNDPAFLMPKSMIGAIRTHCGDESMPIGEVLAVVYAGLAQCYADTLHELAGMTGQMPDALHIIGGGSKDGYLNELTARACGIPVYTGPTEATALGNILSQMIATGVFATVAEARTCVFDSFGVKRVDPSQA
ncbi:MAG: rhamnulokinase [Ruminococcaceae bacterium]|nr:rhamnulokinase [Oscillospiraceae bacterium]